MVTYSRWDPSSGQYDYFEADARPGLNDDLPVPRLPKATELGVPSVECGRPLPPGAAHVGSGERPVGLITPPAEVTRIAGAEAATASTWFIVLAALGAGATGGYLLGRWRG